MCWRSRAIASSAESSLRLVFWPTRILYCFFAGGVLYLKNLLSWQWTLALVVIVAPIVVLEIILRTLVRQRSRIFEHQLMPLLQAGKAEPLFALYKQQTLLRLAAPRHYLLGKLGLIHATLNQHRAAIVAYREALNDAPGNKAFVLLLGLANSLYQLEEDQEAEQVYLEAINEKHINAQACANLARLIIKRGGNKEEAEKYLLAAVDTTQGGILRCELVRLLLDQNKIEDASWHLRLAVEELKQPLTSEHQTILDDTLAAGKAAGIDLGRQTRAEGN